MHAAATERYENMTYRRCGRSGLRLPEISLGLWHNFGNGDDMCAARDMICRAFDLGITHFDLANNYGPPPGSAEETFGRILRSDFLAHRDELIISTKAGYLMWPGPYGQFGSRKHLLASLDQSLRRLRIDYVDVFYNHRYDPDTPLEETMLALSDAVKQGKALYAGISNFDADATRLAAGLLREFNTPLLIHQPRYNLLDRRIETHGILAATEEVGAGCIVFSPLAQGVLTSRYLQGPIPADSRAGKPFGFLRPEHVAAEKLAIARALESIATKRGQSLAQMAISWVLRLPGITSALVGASKVSQVEELAAAALQAPLSEDELARIERILAA